MAGGVGMNEDGNDWPWRLVGILSVLAMSVATVAYIAAYLVQT